MAKKKQVQDPFAQREAAKYADPIPSREFLLTVFEKAPEPLALDALCQQLDLHSPERQEALRRRLIAMTRDGQLVSNRRGVFGLPVRMDLVRGRVQGNKDGYGFFVPETGGDDLVLSIREMQKVFDGDTVLARVVGVDRRGRKEGMVVEILTRRSAQIVGRYYVEQGMGVLIPDNRRIQHEILIPPHATAGAKDGDFVVAEVITWPGERQKPVAEVRAVLGDMRTPGVEVDLAVHSHGIPHRWPDAVEREIARIAHERRPQAEPHRQDLRDLPFVTIDGEDAKDFDDAVQAEPRPQGGWILRVAIADVSHFVTVASALDQEAAHRGTSVYFPGHVIPMLPELLSNNLCSLRPHEDRLVMVCEMEISSQGVLEDYCFSEGVIHSQARLTYTEVASILSEPQNPKEARQREHLRKRHASLIPHLDLLHGVYQQLHGARLSSGALDFDTVETRIVFDAERRIREIVPVVRTVAHRLIEECMLSANVASARLLLASGLPALYRVHQGPGDEKLQNLREFLREMGLSLGGGDAPRPLDYQRLLRRIADRSDARILQTVVIRSLMQAVYQPDNIGHFGLGYDAYTHFTSPIRRYPDLLVHRAIRHLIRSRRRGGHLLRGPGAPALDRQAIYPYSAADMQTLGADCSFAERRADAAAYDVVDWLKCEYIQGHVGDVFAGTVVAVTGFGLFVTLDDIFVEGLVHITALDNDYYHFDPVHHRLTGERTGRMYRLGDAVQVRVAAVSLEDRKIDLVMETTSGKGRGKADVSGRPARRQASAPASRKGKKSPVKAKKATAPSTSTGKRRSRRR